MKTGYSLAALAALAVATPAAAQDDSAFVDFRALKPEVAFEMANAALVYCRDQGYQVANSLNRFAVSSWMPFVYNADGSLDLYVGHADPGDARRSNWLPAPVGPLGITMRLYDPHTAVLDGSWTPPPLTRA